MKARLVRHFLPKHPEEIVIKDEVPLGTEYLVLHFHKDMILENTKTGKKITLDCYLVIGNGSMGYMPAGLLEVIND